MFDSIWGWKVAESATSSGPPGRTVASHWALEALPCAKRRQVPGEPAPPEAWAVRAVALPRKTALLLSNLLRDDTLLCVAAHRLQAPHLVRVGVRGWGWG